MTSAAFEPTRHTAQPRPSAPRLRVVRGGRYTLGRAKTIMQQAGMVLLVALMLALVTAIVASQARLTELSGEIDATRSDLATAQTTYDYLSSQMDKIANMSNLETVAETRLGLVKADPSQITYVRLEDKSVIETVEDGAAKLVEDVRTAALDMLSSLKP